MASGYVERSPVAFDQADRDRGRQLDSRRNISAEVSHSSCSSWFDLIAQLKGLATLPASHQAAAGSPLTRRAAHALSTPAKARGIIVRALAAARSDPDWAGSGLPESLERSLQQFDRQSPQQGINSALHLLDFRAAVMRNKSASPKVAPPRPSEARPPSEMLTVTSESDLARRSSQELLLESALALPPEVRRTVTSGAQLSAGSRSVSEGALGEAGNGSGEGGSRVDVTRANSSPQPRIVVKTTPPAPLLGTKIVLRSLRTQLLPASEAGGPAAGAAASGSPSGSLPPAAAGAAAGGRVAARDWAAKRTGGLEGAPSLESVAESGAPGGAGAPARAEAGQNGGGSPGRGSSGEERGSPSPPAGSGRPPRPSPPGDDQGGRPLKKRRLVRNVSVNTALRKIEAEGSGGLDAAGSGGLGGSPITVNELTGPAPGERSPPGVAGNCVTSGATLPGPGALLDQAAALPAHLARLGRSRSAELPATAAHPAPGAISALITRYVGSNGAAAGAYLHNSHHHSPSNGAAGGASGGSGSGAPARDLLAQLASANGIGADTVALVQQLWAAGVSGIDFSSLVAGQPAPHAEHGAAGAAPSVAPMAALSTAGSLPLPPVHPVTAGLAPPPMPSISLPSAPLRGAPPVSSALPASCPPPTSCALPLSVPLSVGGAVPSSAAGDQVSQAAGAALAELAARGSPTAAGSPCAANHAGQQAPPDNAQPSTHLAGRHADEPNVMWSGKVKHRLGASTVELCQLTAAVPARYLEHLPPTLFVSELAPRAAVKLGPHYVLRCRLDHMTDKQTAKLQMLAQLKLTAICALQHLSVTLVPYSDARQGLTVVGFLLPDEP